MRTRYLQPDHRSVIWHDATRTCATIWSFADRTAALPGRVKDATAGAALARFARSIPQFRCGRPVFSSLAFFGKCP